MLPTCRPISVQFITRNFIVLFQWAVSDWWMFPPAYVLCLLYATLHATSIKPWFADVPWGKHM